MAKEHFIKSLANVLSGGEGFRGLFGEELDFLERDTQWLVLTMAVNACIGGASSLPIEKSARRLVGRMADVSGEIGEAAELISEELKGEKYYREEGAAVERGSPSYPTHVFLPGRVGPGTRRRRANRFPGGTG